MVTMACVLWSGRVWAVSVEAAHIIYLSRAEQHEGGNFATPILG